MPFANRQIANSVEQSEPLILHARAAAGVGGGPDKTILDSPRFYAKFGYRSLLVYLHPMGDPGIDTLRRRASDLDCDFIAIPDRGPLDPRSLNQLIDLCRQRRPAVWHGHDPKTDVLGLIIKRFHPMRLISTAHGWITNSSREKIYKRLDLWALRYYEEVVCVSEKLATECRTTGVPQGRVRLIENGIDLEGYRRTLSTLEAKRKAGLPEDRLVLGSVGRLSDEKGFHLLIEAALKLLEAGADLELRIAGDGPARSKLAQQIAACPWSERIQLLGHVPNPREFYQSLDLFVLSSLTEGLPNCVLEAMALETPVVATRVGGVPNLLQDGVSGILVESGSVLALVDGIRRGQSKEVRWHLAKNARSVVEERHSLERRMRSMCDVYDRLLGNTGLNAVRGAEASEAACN